jgi:hypothetical protein
MNRLFVLYTVELAVSFHRVAVCIMAASRKCLFEDEIEQSLLQELTGSDHSIFSDESDLSGIEDLTVGEVICAKYSDHESGDVQFATPSSVPSVSSASSAVFMWEDMTNYVG